MHALDYVTWRVQSFSSNLTTFAGFYRTGTNTTSAPLAYPLSHARTHEHRSIGTGQPDRGCWAGAAGGAGWGLLDSVIMNCSILRMRYLYGTNIIIK
ncbi:MAG: hypothetical protein K0A89_12320 [ANME-2 cluster archaeon]|nr:hypothetical protein [ANME-2 cluster archaeon]